MRRSVSDVKPTRVLYLDIDGTVRLGFDELGRFVNGPEDVEVFPEVPAILRAYKAEGWRIVGVSNQGGIALGLVPESYVNAAMVKTDGLCGLVFDRMLYCKHHPDAKDPLLARCWCRKPRPGMLIMAAEDLRQAAQRAYDRQMAVWMNDPSSPGDPAPVREVYPACMALMVGDRQEDRDCAAAANVDFMDAAEWRQGGHGLDRLVYCAVCHKSHLVLPGQTPCEPGAWLDPSPIA